MTRPLFALPVVLTLVLLSGCLGGTREVKELQRVAWITQPPAKTLEALKGRPVLLEFWATWCPPCRKTAPHLNRVHQELGPKGLVILSLSDEDRRTVAGFVRQNRLNFAVGAECKSAADYGVKSIPHAFLISPEGKIVWDGHPMDESWVEKARRMLTAKTAS